MPDESHNLAFSIKLVLTVQEHKLLFHMNSFFFMLLFSSGALQHLF